VRCIHRGRPTVTPSSAGGAGRGSGQVRQSDPTSGPMSTLFHVRLLTSHAVALQVYWGSIGVQVPSRMHLTTSSSTPIVGISMPAILALEARVGGPHQVYTAMDPRRMLLHVPVIALPLPSSKAEVLLYVTFNTKTSYQRERLTIHDIMGHGLSNFRAIVAEVATSATIALKFSSPMASSNS
jgi:hypothetical protein